MKVLLINGSPHENGTTYHALSRAAEALNKEGIETEIVWIGTKPIGGCIACFKCRELKECVFGGVVNEVRKKAYESDGFLFGTPVHYAGAGGNMTAFLDRLFYSELCGNNNAAFRLKPAAAVVCARRGGCTASMDVLNKYFSINQMPIASSTYWNQIHGGKPGEAALDPEGVRTMRNLAKNMVFLMESIAMGREKNGLPVPEPAIYTNFIR